AGAMVALVGAGWAMALNAVGFGLSALLLARLKLPRTATLEKSHMLTDLKQGWKEFSSRQWLWVVVAQFSILVAGIEAFYGVLGPVGAKHDLGGGPGWAAGLGGGAITSLVGGVVAIPRHARR